MKNISLPKEFEEALKEKLGKSFDEFLSSLQQPSPVSIRTNPHKPLLIEGESVAWSKFGKYLPERPVFTLDPSFHAGAYYVQEASSMFLEQAISQAVDLSKPINVLDLCAAPGGKSTHILSLLHPESLLVSNEVIRSRANILSENIQKWGHSNVLVTNNDPEQFSNLHGFFDLIIVDAPCSGEGLFRKDPDAVKEWSPANVDLCSKRQKRILADIWPCLKTNGLLIYSTCTYNQHENEENMQWLQKQKGVQSIPLNLNPSWGVEVIDHKNISGYRFFPHKTKGEGFFLSVIQKLDEQPAGRSKSKKSLDVPARKIADQLKEWILKDNVQFQSHQDLVFSIPSALQQPIEYLAQHLKIVHAGTGMATLKHDKLIPEHPLALSIDLKRGLFQELEVSLEEALNYLRKETIQTGSVKKGYCLITYQQLPLGWINVLDNRSNNLYPKEWRIRMAG